MEKTPSLPTEVLGKVFPLLRNAPKAWFNLARTNKELYRLSSVLRGPQKWPELIVDWSDGGEEDDEVERGDNDSTTSTTINLEHYVHQVKFSPNGCHMAMMLRVYQGAEATDYQRLVRIFDIDEGPMHDLLVGRSAPFSEYCQGENGGAYLIVAEPRLVRMFAVQEHYLEVRQISSSDRIVGFKVLSDLQAVLQTEQERDGVPLSCLLSVWNLGAIYDENNENASSNIYENRRVIFDQAAGSFCVAQKGKTVILACMQFGPYADRSLTVLFIDDGDPRQYAMQIPGTNNRSWIDTCRLSPDGAHLAVLTEERIYLANTAVEPPHWEEAASLVVPDRCTFSGQLLFSPDSTRLLAHARTPWGDIYQHRQVCNTVQIWNVAGPACRLVATKRFHDVAGSVGISQDGKFVVILQGNETDVYNTPIERILTRYISVMEDHSPLLESSDEEDEVIEPEYGGYDSDSH